MLFRAHMIQLRKRFGKKRADNANVGWESGDDFITSKVYGEYRADILISSIVKNKIIHEESEY